MLNRYFSQTGVNRLIAALFCALLVIPSPANAQFSASYSFLKAVRDRDGEEATKFLNQPGTTIVNTREMKTGETALHITVARRDSAWTGFLLQKGANPNMRDKQGVTPLMVAAQLRYIEGARLLISQKAKVDETNDQGETPLIRAVQLRDSEMVRYLLSEGANPDITDTLAGLSARDYAARDGRSSAILQEIEKADENKKTKESGRFFGPQE